MTRCECVSVGCEQGEHFDPECSNRASTRVHSRDFDDRYYAMCSSCAAGAVESGMFDDLGGPQE